RSVLTQRLGPWAVSHPAAYVGERALRDHSWHQQAREQLQQRSQQLHQLLAERIDTESIHATALFSTLQLTSPQAESLFAHCAQQGVLLRHFPQWGKIRVGLTTKSGMDRLRSALECWKI
ncbi:MAG: aminotransferase class I/II-fold pyridoxal phosphate-dependent enzyme, partial [Gammaproteobacteria bacterium]|nr:aminotransferase class I/II-fold pyridoxal phosphate-dependent enzyme [Gammaproteobacteria bacterium]